MPSTKDFRGQALAQSITAVMDRMEAKFRKAFLALLSSVVDDPNLRAVLQMVASGEASLASVSMMQAIDAIEVDPTVLRNITRQAMASGGKATAKSLGFEGRFDVTNPRAVEYARNLSSDLIVGITRGVRQNIRDIIGDAVAGDATPNETVRRIKSEVGLTPRDAAAVRNYRKQLVASGKSKQEAARLSQQYAERLLKARAKTIARTETAVAVTTGQQEFWQQMKDDGAVPANAERVWITASDERTCAICGPMNGVTAPIDGVWQTASGIFSIPHAHPNCRCTSGLVFPNKVKKADPTGYEQWILDKGYYPGHPFRGNRGLKQWFREDWVDLSRPKKGGGFEPCGRPDASEGKYPKCVPAARAASMTPEEIRSAIRRKRRAESTTARQDKKPVMVPTISKLNVPSDMELYNKVKAEAKAKFDVYPSAYANGWLVQEYKRRGGTYKTINKGDYPGHPFRGNQWTGGIGRGGGRGAIRGIATDQLKWASTDYTEDDLSYSDELSKAARAEGGKLTYLSEGGSYYDYVDWDDTTRTPAEQMAESFTAYTGVQVRFETNRGTRNFEPEAMAEVLDAVTVMLSEWPGTQLGVVTFTDRLGSGTLAGAGLGSKSAVESTGGRLPPRQISGKPASDDAVPVLFVNTRLMHEAEQVRSEQAYSERTGEFVRTRLSTHQSTIVHEWGHVVEQNMALRAPRTMMKIQHEVAKLISPEYKRDTTRYLQEGKGSSSLAAIEGPRINWDVQRMQKRFATSTSVHDVGGPLRHSFFKLPVGRMSSIISGYGATNGAEVIAESFLAAYGGSTVRMTPEQKRYANAVKKIYDGLWDEAVAEGY